MIRRSSPSSPAQKFIPVKNEDYAPIEEVGKTTGLLN